MQQGSYIKTGFLLLSVPIVMLVYAARVIFVLEAKEDLILIGIPSVWDNDRYLFIYIDVSGNIIKKK